MENEYCCISIREISKREEKNPLSKREGQEKSVFAKCEDKEMAKEIIKTKIHQNINIDPNTGCWNWLKSKTSRGYGVVYFKDKLLPTHRASYEIHFGIIPQGKDLDHLCRNRGCCNPEHLEPVTRQQNLLRSNLTLTYQNKIKTHCPNGHEYSKENTKIRRNSRECKICIREKSLERYHKKQKNKKTS